MAYSFGAPKIVTNGLVLYLDAANRRSYPGSGTAWNDLSGNGNNGTLTNGPTFNGDNAGSIVFDGVDDYVSFTNPGLTTSFSLIAWVNPSRFPANTAEDNGIFGTLTTSPRCQFDFNEGPTPGTTTRLRFFDSGISPQALEYTLNVSDVINTWSHVGVTRTGSTTILYFNGVTLLSGTQTGNVNADDLVVLGTSATTGAQYFEGKISHAKIYNRALSAEEVLQNYNATKARYNL